MPEEQVKSAPRQLGEIFLVSVLILFLELVMIRWIGSEIAVFSFLGNLILVVCFFGVGLGCYLADRPVSLSRLGVNVLLLAVLVSNPLNLEALNLKRVSLLLGGLEYFSLWKSATGLNAFDVAGGFAILGLLLFLITYSFLPLGQLLGNAFARAPRTIAAYSINIAGSLAGVWLFNAFSWISAPPTVWFTAAAFLFLILALIRRNGWSAALLIGAAAFAVWFSARSPNLTLWSPYHKLTLEALHDGEGAQRVDVGYTLHSNYANYQQLLDFSDAFSARHPGIISDNQRRFGSYDLPFCFKPSPKRVLIVGAGAGNNAAGALRHGAGEVDCVDIDPVIFDLGVRFHPEHPYDSPQVHRYVDDARAFFKKAKGQYDIIWFGWLDSHVLGTAYSNLRLDHYVYTRESIREAARLLTDDGLIVMTMGSPVGQRNWIGDRQLLLLRDVFGHDPFAYIEGTFPEKFGKTTGVTLVCGKKPLTLDDIHGDPERNFLKDHLADLPHTTRPTTDDWPYLYLESAHIPRLHWITSLLLLGAVTVTRRRAFRTNAAIDWHYFFLGAAFLLLEVQTVSRATLLFGMTWLVNAIVISAVLVMILLSNLVAAAWPKLPRWIPLLGLTLSILALALVPLDWFNTFTGLAKLLSASAFLTAPLFFGGLIFIRSFAVSPDKSRALGSNLIGALVGGLLESLAFLTGIRALVVLVGLFYLAAVWQQPADSKK